MWSQVIQFSQMMSFDTIIRQFLFSSMITWPSHTHLNAHTNGEQNLLFTLTWSLSWESHNYYQSSSSAPVHLTIHSVVVSFVQTLVALQTSPCDTTLILVHWVRDHTRTNHTITSPYKHFPKLHHKNLMLAYSIWGTLIHSVHCGYGNGGTQQTKKHPIIQLF